MSKFSTYLRELADAFPSRQALAEELDIAPPRLSRAIAGKDGYAFNVENCLRLAKAAKRPATEVLRMAGKGEVADLLEFLFPRAGRQAMTGAQAKLLEDWVALSEDERSVFGRLIHERAAELRRRTRA